MKLTYLACGLLGTLSGVETQEVASPPSAQAVVERALAAYGARDRYRDTATMRSTLRSGDLEIVTADDYSFHFLRGRGFALKSCDGHSIHREGDELITHLTHSGRYLKVPFPTEGDWKPAAGFVGKLVPAFHPVAEILIRNEPAGFPGWLEGHGVTREDHAGRPAWRLRATLDFSAIGEPHPVPSELWFDVEDGLLRRVVADLAASRPNTPEGDTHTWELVFRPGGEVQPEDLVFRPRPVDKRVESFLGTPAGEDDDGTMAALLGRPAPRAMGLDLEGKPLNLADLRGKVVVLEFWATWCGACSFAAEYLRELEEVFADNPDVVFLGVNLDDREDQARARETWKKRGLTGRNFADPDSAISSAFRILGTPTFAIVDRDGVLAWIHSGQGPWLVKRYTELIERALAGEPLDQR